MERCGTLLVAERGCDLAGGLSVWARENGHTGVDNGPIKVTNTNNGAIIASERINLKKNPTYSSYSELMGIPASKLTDTYLFPWYNNTGYLVSQLRFGNVGSAPTTVTVKIGGVVRGTYDLAANASTRVDYPGVDSGPVEVKSSGGVPIIAALRVNLKKMPTYSSYSEFLGLSASGAVSTALHLPLVQQHEPVELTAALWECGQRSDHGDSAPTA